ncbi:MAG TPA: ATP phosphoribosyltransferase [Chloroflexota bacterium]|nr:ATP phosphoribosyltransferase [Chloroflexota bacterium]
MSSDKLRLALPSKGRMEDTTLDFMRSSGLRVARPNPRQYTASIRAVPGAQVIFQRSGDIYRQVNAGNVDAGITGLDDYSEQRQDGDSTNLIFEDLGYSRCELVLAVPESWSQVSTLSDLTRLATERHDEGRELRIATHFPNLVGAFCRGHGIQHFLLETQYEGTLEMAPNMGTADLIADLSETGTTIKENHLKLLGGGTVLKSQACLIGNRATLADEGKLHIIRHMLELMEASLRSEGFYYLIANVAGSSEESVAQLIFQRPELAGLTGPTISKVYPKSGTGSWYDVTIIVQHEGLITAIDHLREIGATGIAAIPTKYSFEDRCRAYERLAEACRTVNPRLL